MLALERRNLILEKLQEEKRVVVSELSQLYSCLLYTSITLSGGECMCQADFSRDLLRAAKERGINTAVESMACAPWEKIEQVLPLSLINIFARFIYRSQDGQCRQRSAGLHK